MASKLYNCNLPNPTRTQNPQWFMLKEELENITLHWKNGRITQGHAEKGTILIPCKERQNTVSPGYVYVELLKESRFTIKCRRDILIDLNKEDVNWLVPVISPNERFSLYNDKQHWEERHQLKKGQAIYYIKRTKKRKATVISWGYSRDFDGNMIQIKLKEDEGAEVFGSLINATLSEVRIRQKSRKQALYDNNLKKGDRVVFLDDNEQAQYGTVLGMKREMKADKSPEFSVDVQLDKKKDATEFFKSATVRVNAKTLMKASDFDGDSRIQHEEKYLVGQKMMPVLLCPFNKTEKELKQQIQSNWKDILHSTFIQNIVEKALNENILSEEGTTCIRSLTAKDDKHRMFLCWLLGLKGDMFHEALKFMCSLSLQFQDIMFSHYKGTILDCVNPPCGIPDILKGLHEEADYICRTLNVTAALDTMFENFELPLDFVYHILTCFNNYTKTAMLLNLLSQPDAEETLCRFLTYLESNSKDLYKIILGGTMTYDADRYSKYGMMLIQKKSKLIPLLQKESEILLVLLESKGVLVKSERQELLSIENSYDRVNDLLEIIATKDNKYYETLVSVLDENGDHVASKILKDTARTLSPENISHRSHQLFEEDNQKKTDTTGNLFQNPIEKKRPVNLTSEEVMGECSVGSPVEVHLNGIKTGIVRWIGYVKDPSCLIAGLEMDEEVTGSEKGSCGMLNGYQMFTCEPRKGLFISLNKCKPARRFVAAHQAESVSDVKVRQSPKTDARKAEVTRQVVLEGRKQNLTEGTESAEQMTRLGSPVPVNVTDGPLTLGSRVQFFHHNQTWIGVIRWIGHVGDATKLIAGIETDEKFTEKDNAGCLKGRKLFVCEPGKGAFTRLDKCTEVETIQVNTRKQDNTFDSPAEWKKLRPLGAGSFGEVFLCEDKVGRQFACKEIKSSIEDIQLSEVKMLQTEIETLKKIKHLRVVEYLGYYQSEFHINIFLEYMKGGSVRSKLAKEGSFPEHEVRHYTKQILEGVAFLHDNNIIHRDIKGSNILLDGLGNIKLGDFGTAVHVKTIHGRTATKNKQTGIGTPNWMAPEVIQGKKYGRKVDIWSIGCTVVEMFTKQPPWSGLDAFAAVFRIVNDEKPDYTLPEGVSPEVDQFLLCCFCKDPEKRSTADELFGHVFCQKT